MTPSTAQPAAGRLDQKKSSSRVLNHGGGRSGGRHGFVLPATRGVGSSSSTAAPRAAAGGSRSRRRGGASNSSHRPGRRCLVSCSGGGRRRRAAAVADWRQGRGSLLSAACIIVVASYAARYHHHQNIITTLEEVSSHHYRIVRPLSLPIRLSCSILSTSSPPQNSHHLPPPPPPPPLSPTLTSRMVGQLKAASNSQAQSATPRLCGPRLNLLYPFPPHTPQKKSDLRLPPPSGLAPHPTAAPPQQHSLAMNHH